VEVALAGDGVVFGRAPGVTIPLPYAKVSARHARLFRDGENYRLEDLGSTNGTRLGSRKLSPRVPETIAFGELIDMGGVQVCFEGESPDTVAVSAALGTQTLARRLVHDLFEFGPPAEPARIVVLSGRQVGCTLVLSASGRVFKIGRGEGCDLVVYDEDVSREHAAIERGAGGFAVRDLGSKNGVEVSGEVITGQRYLRDGEIIDVGETRLRFTDPEDRYLRQMQAAEMSAQAALSASAPPPKTRLEPSRLPAVAAAIAVTVLLTTLGLVLALAFVPHL
jgi:pSer/pThr/pTyr-binding forkhead associated (FHA) protein